MKSNIWILYMFLGMVAFTCGEVVSKHYANTLNKWYMALAIVTYMSGTFMWLGVMRNNNQIAVMNTIWCLLSLVIGIGVGVLYFKEALTVYQWVGIGLALVATYLLVQ